MSILNYIKRQPLKEKVMELVSQFYEFFSFLRPYKFLIMGISVVLFVMCIVMAMRARKCKKDFDYDDYD